jgi:hypothetical protein
LTDVEAIERVMTLLVDEWEELRRYSAATYNRDAKMHCLDLADTVWNTFRILDGLRYKVSQGATPLPGAEEIIFWKGLHP